MGQKSGYGELEKYYDNRCEECGEYVGGYYRKLNGCLCATCSFEYECGEGRDGV